MGDFYITLQSDSCIDFYPENTITSFRNNFPEPIWLDGKYEVALIDCIYHHSSNFLPRKILREFRVDQWKSDRNILTELYDCKSIEQAAKHFSDKYFEMKIEGNRMVVKKLSPMSRIFFNEEFANIIGYSNKHQQVTHDILVNETFFIFKYNRI